MRPKISPKTTFFGHFFAVFLQSLAFLGATCSLKAHFSVISCRVFEIGPQQAGGIVWGRLPHTVPRCGCLAPLPARPRPTRTPWCAARWTAAWSPGLCLWRAVVGPGRVWVLGKGPAGIPLGDAGLPGAAPLAQVCSVWHCAAHTRLRLIQRLFSSPVHSRLWNSISMQPTHLLVPGCPRQPGGAKVPQSHPL